MSTLARHLRTQIELSGPITVAEFMAQALGHPRYGYYMRGDPLGRDGDFITAPEVSQMFGELIGLWCVAAWQQMDRPRRAALVELGPGRGTLMSDALRAMTTVPDCRAAIEVHLVETSPALRERQRHALADVAATWHETLHDVPEAPHLLVANEMFDALPVHQFVRTVGGWRERLVDLQPASGRFRFVLAPGPSPVAALIPDEAAQAPPGSMVELAPGAISLAHEIGRRVTAYGGAALIVDYGATQGAVGDTLQAVHRHRRHDVLEDPGSADLSARVDFGMLARAAREAGARTFGPLTQRDFLRALGIETRAAMLARNATAAQRADIEAARRRLTEPAQMGTLFKALAIVHPDAPAPAGFEALA